MVNWLDHVAPSIERRWAVALLVCLLAAMSVAQAAHSHKDNANPHHAYAVCSMHAPALARSIVPMIPPAATARPIYVAGTTAHSSSTSWIPYIRPQPSVWP